VVIQAQGAQRTLKRDPAMASAAMRDVEQTGRTALEEMRRMLGLLRTGELAAGDGGEPAAEDCDRQPGGHGDAHPAADDAEATVRLNYEAGLDVTITDDGRGAAAHLGAGAARVSGAGRGMTGMHERVAAAGGRLTVGPRPGGGFSVHARIPLEGRDQGPARR
jgi:signal transduction histidine kinase